MKQLLTLAYCLSATLFLTSGLSAKEPLGKRWSAKSQVSMDQISHDRFDRLLNKYVDRDGYVAYAKWHASSTDRKELRIYLTELSRASLSTPATRNGQLAFWINAYNAATIEGILQVYPTSSIRNHTAKVFGYNIWKNLPLIVGNRQYSLEEIEHSKLRKMSEPRIHFAIVCASVGCPTLLNAAYQPATLESQLAQNAKDFFSRPKNFRLDANNNRIYLSSIMDWFAEDFGANQTAQLKTISPYLPSNAQALLTRKRMSVSHLTYDWSLNDQKTKKE